MLINVFSKKVSLHKIGYFLKYVPTYIYCIVNIVLNKYLRRCVYININFVIIFIFFYYGDYHLCA